MNLKNRLRTLFVFDWSQRTWMQLFTAIAPLAAMTIGYKLLKVYVNWAEFNRVESVALTHRLMYYLPFLLVIAFGVPLLLYARRRWVPRVSPACALIGFLLVEFIGEVAFHLATGTLTEPRRWYTAKLVEFLRWDFVFLFAYTLVWGFILDSARGIIRTIAYGALLILSTCLIAISSAEFAYFRTTGSMGNIFLLRHFIKDFHDISFVVASEVKGVNLLVLLFPVVVVLLPFILARHSIIKRCTARCAAGRGPRWVVWPIVGALILAPSVPLERAQGRFTENVNLKLLDDLVSNPYWRLSAEGALSDASFPRPFDTARLHLVETERTRLKNVVIIVLESARRNSVTPYDTALATTPFLADLARRSITVDRMYTVLPNTTKALSAILCGVYPAVTQTIVEAEPGGPGSQGLPRLLKPLGYRSAFFSPAYLQFENNREVLQNAGFETIRGDGEYDTTGYYRVDYFGYEDRIMLKPCLAWVDSILSGGQPFLLTMLTLTGHHDYQTPPSFSRVKFKGIDDPQLNDYLNAMRYIDEFLKDLFHAFEVRGVLDSSLFVILGDHGEAFGEHGQWQHLALSYEEGLVVPALVLASDLPGGPRRVGGLRQQIDVVPTITELLGLEIRDGYLPGTSLLQSVPEDRTLYFSSSYEREFMALRRGNLKYVYHYNNAPMEVYDLAVDAQERDNLVDRFTQEALRKVEIDLFRWQQQVNELYLGVPAGAESGLKESQE